jgi:ribonuclease HII
MPSPDLSRLTVQQARDLLSAGPPDEALLCAMEADPRKGVKALARSTRKQLRKAQAERARLEKLLALEQSLRRKGYRQVAGVDEAGRGPLAGPVMAAAVILPEEVCLPGLDDSKALTARRREALYEEIRDRATAYAVAEATVEEIDALNILQATYLAMRRALSGLSVTPDHVLVDGNGLPESGLRESSVVDGDARSACIAAASILAKVTRDRRMAELDRTYPGYGFSRHKGYGSPDHLAALRRHGPSPVHRTSFEGVGGSARIASEDGKAFAEGIRQARDLPALEAIGKSIGLAGADLAAAELEALRECYRERRTRLSRTGPRGEQEALRELERQGYEVLVRGYRAAGGEVDVVAATGDILAFVEVKTGTGTGFAAPESWVTPRKQRQIVRVARAYLQRHPHETRTPRFDVLVVDYVSGRAAFRHLADAFRASP